MLLFPSELKRKAPQRAGPLLGTLAEGLLVLAGLVVLTALLSALAWVLRLLAGLLIRLTTLLLATLAALLVLLAALVLLRILLVLIWIVHVNTRFLIVVKLTYRWLLPTRVTTSFFPFFLEPFSLST
jgi:hypothetical protein